MILLLPLLVVSTRHSSRRPTGATILDHIAHCLDVIPTARAEEPDPRPTNWERLCVLGWTTVVERVLASEPAIDSTDDWRQVKGKGPKLLVRREENDLVIAIQESRDGRGSAPDSIDDAVLIDYDADGTVDRAVDWEDLDHDGLADRQVLYALTPGPWHATQMSCILIEQHDHDGKLWHLVRWQYMQSQCQWSCDFAGNGFFTAARFDDSTGRWTTFDENPFCFYDRDDDGYSDEALRLSGEDADLRSIRWSFDLDHDAGHVSRGNANGSPYDYDLSITAVGRVIIPPADRDTLILRAPGERCGREQSARNDLVLVAYDRAREAAAAARWEKVLLTFDENDHNVDPNDALAHERWEGVIAEGVPGFPAVGGPPCGFSDKRYEVNRDAYQSGRIELYESPYDRRLHLLGADWGMIEHDANGDGRRDELLRTEDRDGDGRFDTWLFDRDADGTWDLEWHPRAGAKGDTSRAIVMGSQGYFEALIEAEARSLAGVDSTRAPITQAERYAAELAAWRAGTPPLIDR